MEGNVLEKLQRDQACGSVSVFDYPRTAMIVWPCWKPWWSGLNVEYNWEPERGTCDWIKKKKNNNKKPTAWDQDQKRNRRDYEVLLVSRKDFFSFPSFSLSNSMPPSPPPRRSTWCWVRPSSKAGGYKTQVESVSSFAGTWVVAYCFCGNKIRNNLRIGLYYGKVPLL